MTLSDPLQGDGIAVHEDVDVVIERQRVEGGGANSDSLCLKNLHKAYESKVPCNLHTCPGHHLRTPAWLVNEQLGSERALQICDAGRCSHLLGCHYLAC